MALIIVFKEQNSGRLVRWAKIKITTYSNSRQYCSVDYKHNVDGMPSSTVGLIITDAYYGSDATRFSSEYRLRIDTTRTIPFRYDF